MAYSKGLVFSIDSSASLLPCNLSILSTRHSEKGRGEANKFANKFAVIHKHLANSGVFGSSSSKHLSHGEDRSSYLTQVSVFHFA